MLLNFSGRTVSDSYGLEQGGIHLPRYPHFDRSRQRRGGYFYARSQRYLNCQSARFVLVGGELITLIDESAIDPTRDLDGWWSGYYREHFGEQQGEIIKFSQREEMCRYIAEHPRTPVVAPHPYDEVGVPSRCFYLDDPSLILRLNDKGRMNELSSRTIPYCLYSAEAFARDEWKPEWRLPFVVKLTEPSGGGDGVAICLTEADIERAKQRFAGRMVKIEHYIDNPANNYNINLRVDKTGQARFIGGSLQQVSSEGKYAGNFIDLGWRPSADLEDLCIEIANNAWQAGWHGVCGLDILENSDGELYFMDPNFRLNGSTPFYLLRDYFGTHYQQPILETGYFHYRGDPVAFLDAFKTEIERKILAPIGLYFDPKHDGKTRVYAAIAAEGDFDEIRYRKRQLAEKQLLPGIDL